MSDSSLAQVTALHAQLMLAQLHAREISDSHFHIVTEAENVAREAVQRQKHEVIHPAPRQALASEICFRNETHSTADRRFAD